MWGFIEVVLEVDPPVLAWTTLLGVPALLTVGAGVLTRRSALETVVGAVASAGLAFAAIVVTVLLALRGDTTWS